MNELGRIRDLGKEQVIPVTIALCKAKAAGTEVSIGYNGGGILVALEGGVTVEYAFDDLIRDALAKARESKGGSSGGSSGEPTNILRHHAMAGVMETEGA